MGLTMKTNNKSSGSLSSKQLLRLCPGNVVYKVYGDGELNKVIIKQHVEDDGFLAEDPSQNFSISTWANDRAYSLHDNWLIFDNYFHALAHSLKCGGYKHGNEDQET